MCTMQLSIIILLYNRVYMCVQCSCQSLYTCITECTCVYNAVVNHYTPVYHSVHVCTMQLSIIVYNAVVNHYTPVYPSVHVCTCTVQLSIIILLYNRVYMCVQCSCQSLYSCITECTCVYNAVVNHYTPV